MKHLGRREFLGAGAAMLASPAMRAAAAPKPNLLFLLPDQWRYDWLGDNPNLPVRTPNLDALAERGTRFTKAAVASPVCAPSRACLADGREYDECGVPSNSFNYPVAQTTYYQKLLDAGYHTMGCGKLDLSKPNYDNGVDGRNHMEEWGFSDMNNCGGKGDALLRNGAEEPHEPYMAYLKSLDLARVHADDIEKRGGQMDYSKTFPTPLPDDAYQDNWIGRSGLELLERAPAGRPWHLVVNLAGPHNPMDITARMETAVRGRRYPQPNGSTEFTPEIHNTIRENYTAMCENLDRWVGIYVDELERRGELDNTVIVFSSDHGEMLGDHDRWRKSVPYEESLSVPLIVAGPGMKAGQRSDALVNLIDVAATFLDYAGGSMPEGATARSFRPLLEGKTRSHREYLSSGLGGWRLVTDGRYKLVRGFDPVVRRGAGARAPARGPGDLPLLLFDLEADPLENTNFADKAPDVVAHLSKLLPPPNADPRFAPGGGGRRRG